VTREAVLISNAVGDNAPANAELTERELDRGQSLRTKWIAHYTGVSREKPSPQERTPDRAESAARSGL